MMKGKLFLDSLPAGETVVGGDGISYAMGLVVDGDVVGVLKYDSFKFYKEVYNCNDYLVEIDIHLTQGQLEELERSVRDKEVME